MLQYKQNMKYCRNDAIYITNSSIKRVIYVANVFNKINITVNLCNKFREWAYIFLSDLITQLYESDMPPIAFQNDVVDINMFKNIQNEWKILAPETNINKVFRTDSFNKLLLKILHETIHVPNLKLNKKGSLIIKKYFTLESIKIFNKLSVNLKLFDELSPYAFLDNKHMKKTNKINIMNKMYFEACMYGNLSKLKEIIKMSIRYHIRIDLDTSAHIHDLEIDCRMTALSEACRRGYFDIVEYLIHLVDIGYGEIDIHYGNDRSLCFAISNKHDNIVKLLMTLDASRYGEFSEYVYDLIEDDH